MVFCYVLCGCDGWWEGGYDVVEDFECVFVVFCEVIDDVVVVGVEFFVVEFFGCDDFVDCGFDQWWVVEEDCVLFVDDDCFVVYCWYVGVVCCVGIEYCGELWDVGC